MEGLTAQERELVLALTHEETARRFAEVLGKPGSLTTSPGLARREWQLHKGIITAVESRKFREAHPDASEAERNLHIGSPHANLCRYRIARMGSNLSKFTYIPYT